MGNREHRMVFTNQPFQTTTRKEGRLMESQTDSVEQSRVAVLAYHEETKHRFDRYARSLGYLDWANQPVPFRSFEGCERILLPLSEEDTTPPYDTLFESAGTHPQPISTESIGRFFEMSLALSAWKESGGGRWALRINPSSGNLHPTEGYAILDLSSVEPEKQDTTETPIVCHYAPEDHSFEVRARFPQAVWQDLSSGFPAGTFLVGLTSIHWREAWKYGERAFRYCQHDIGHALAALRLSAAALGWRLLVLHDLSDSEVAAVLGVDREDGFHELERETPAFLAAVFPGPIEPGVQTTLSAFAIKAIASGDWFGRANGLSREHCIWEIIDEAGRATEKPHTDPTFGKERETSSPNRKDNVGSEGQDSDSCSSKSAYQVFLQRRSAVAMDGRTGISAQDFYRLMERTLPSGREKGIAPPVWDALPWEPRVHLCIFAHRIERLDPGLYILVRNPDHEAPLRLAMKSGFQWDAPADCPLPFYRLQTGDFRMIAEQISCTQEIASHGAFSLGMIAEFEDSIRREGAWHYRRLFWESGMVGQVLYLEAEVVGLRGTGIGCFFDDAMHELLGLKGRRFQSLYHFTVGKPIEDPRLSTLPPYSEERRRRLEKTARD